MRYFLLFLLMASSASSHELTPTYPKMKPSYMDNVLVTTMRMFNKRIDVKYYELSVYDEEWNPLPFASQGRIIELDYLETKTFDVYIRETDFERAEFICTKSKLIRGDVISTGIASRVCSRIK